MLQKILYLQAVISGSLDQRKFNLTKSQISSLKIMGNKIEIFPGVVWATIPEVVVIRVYFDRMHYCSVLNLA